MLCQLNAQVEDQENIQMETNDQSTMPPRQKHGQSLTQHSATGLVVFNSTGQLLFMNRESHLFIWQLQSRSTKESGTSMIPEELHAVLRDLIGHLKSCTHPKDCENIQTERLCFASNQEILLRGFCIPEEPLAQQSRFLIIMEKPTQQLGCPDALVQQRYHLTEREQMVITYLMLGFTNKEIAMRLNLSEYTVKDHFKRIMDKTNTRTRTGLLSRMIFSTPHGGLSSGEQIAEIEEALGHSETRKLCAMP